MKLAYFSPLNPQPSGISDYSEELLPYLATHAGIDLFVYGFQPSNRELPVLNCFDYQNDPATLNHLNEYDAVIYHVGNDHRYHASIIEVMRHHPGIAVFHEYVLQDYFLGQAHELNDMSLYLAELEACHGKLERAKAEESLRQGALPPQAAAPLDYPLNCRLARSAEGIIVHSEWNRVRFQQIAPDVPTARVNMGVKPLDATLRTAWSRRNPLRRFISIASFGLIIPRKGIDQVLQALGALKEQFDFHYTLVGAENPYFDVRELIIRHGMTEHVTITGHVSLEEFERQIAATDIAINLREYTVGETSASLCRIMGVGVPTVVSDIGWFSEIPDDCVVKVKPDDTLAAALQSNLSKLMEDSSLRKTIGEHARKFVITEHNIWKTADDYMAFIRKVVAHRAPKSLANTPSWSRPTPSEVIETASQLPAALEVQGATTRSNGEAPVSLAVERETRSRDRLRVAYFSPFGPQRSGIADYSEELLPHLANGADITLFIDGFQPSNSELIAQFEVCDYQKDPKALARLDRFDAVLYHMGNDHRYHAGIFDAMRQHSGVIVFHDFTLQDFFLGLARARHDMRIYLDEVGAGHGETARGEAAATLARGGVPAIAARPVEFPLNQRLARGAEGIIVHSEWSGARLQRIAPGVPVRVVQHHVMPQAADRLTSTSRSEPGPVRIASFGIITPDKGIERSLSALAALRDKCDFHYAMVGEPSSYFDVRAMVRRYGLEDRVEITGHVTLEEFERRIGETDIVLNLRARTNGETSGSLCRVMAAGVAAIVSDMGWFSELPADTVVKVDQGEHSEQLLRAYLERLIEDPELRGRIGANARRHMLEKHDIERSAAGYLSFINEIVSARPRRRLVSGLTAELSALGLTPDRDEKLFHTVAAGVAELAPEHWFQPSPAISGVSQTGNGLRRGGVASSTPDQSVSNSEAEAAQKNDQNGRLRMPGIDYKQAAIEYLGELNEERQHHLRTKPFYNLANKPAKYKGDGMDEDTHRHFCDFANMSIVLALPPQSRILDVGCGSGWLSEYFARLGYVVKGIDISPDLIEMSRLRVDRVPYGVDHETPLHCTFEVHDIELAPLKEKFDAIVCYDSLHHFEDERAVIRHLATMLEVGGMLFILEGERPPAGSQGEAELLAVMREFRTLESPFDSRYLRHLLDENGLAIVGDYVSVNGLFSRESFDGDRLRIEVPKLNYFLCKKVTATLGQHASTVPDSRSPSMPRANLSFAEPLPLEIVPNGLMKTTLLVENTGDTLWLVGPAERAGSVMVGTKVFDDEGVLVVERHGTPALQRALAPGERARLAFEFQAPHTPGHYMLKLDLVAQQVCWFEERGSTPLEVGFFVR